MIPLYQDEAIAVPFPQEPVPFMEEETKIFFLPKNIEVTDTPKDDGRSLTIKWDIPEDPDYS